LEKIIKIEAGQVIKNELQLHICCSFMALVSNQLYLVKKKFIYLSYRAMNQVH